MILFIILAITLMTLIAVTILAIGVGGAGFIVVFGDVIVCIAIVVFIMILIVKRKKKWASNGSFLFAKFASCIMRETVSSNERAARRKTVDEDADSSHNSHCFF